MTSIQLGSFVALLLEISPELIRINEEMCSSDSVIQVFLVYGKSRSLGL